MYSSIGMADPYLQNPKTDSSSINTDRQQLLYPAFVR
jgi:hypothetical protein